LQVRPETLLLLEMLVLLVVQGRLRRRVLRAITPEDTLLETILTLLVVRQCMDTRQELWLPHLTIKAHSIILR